MSDPGQSADEYGMHGPDGQLLQDLARNRGRRDDNGCQRIENLFDPHPRGRITIDG